MARWEQDDAGQWWYYRGNGIRTRGELRTCQLCGEEFKYVKNYTRGVDRGLYCGRACANKATKNNRFRHGPDHPNWRGGRHVRKRDGYVQVNTARDEKGERVWQLEHRHVMSEHLGRALLPEETVHHRNGDKTDNRLENLELWSSRHPRGKRVEDLLDFADEVIALYR